MFPTNQNVTANALRQAIKGRPAPLNNGSPNVPNMPGHPNRRPGFGSFLRQLFTSKPPRVY